MLDQVLRLFDITPDYPLTTLRTGDLNIMEEDQSPGADCGCVDALGRGTLARWHVQRLNAQRVNVERMRLTGT